MTEGRTLRAEREAAGVGRGRLARVMGRDTATLWRWERAAIVKPWVALEYRAGLERARETT